MIVVDTTVWIDYFIGIKKPQTDFLENVLPNKPLLIGNIILGEVLRGFHREEDSETARFALSHLHQVNMINTNLAIQSARNYRTLRKIGITARKTIDCFIATYCIENDHGLLPNDHDYDPFKTHLELQVIHPED